MYELDLSGRFQLVNRAFASLVGTDAEDLLGRSYEELLRPEHDGVEEHFQAALRGERVTFIVRSQAPDGTQHSLQVTNLPVVEDGRVTRIYGILRDVSQQADVQRALEVSERRFRGLFEGAGFGIAITELDGRFVEANESFRDLLGYTMDELCELDLEAVLVPEENPEYQDRIAALISGDVAAFVIEQQYLKKGGATVWGRTSFSLIRDSEGEPLHLAATVENITAAKAADERLRRSETLRRLAGQLARVGGWSIEAQDHKVYWSEEIYRLLDAPEGDEPPLDESIGLYAVEDRDRLGAAIEACLADGTPFDLELQLTTYDGRQIPVRAIAEPQYGTRGEIERIIGAFQDITDLRAATAHAEELAQRLTTTLESMTDALYTIDRDWRFTYLNERAGELLQADRDALLGQVVWDAFPEARQVLYEPFQRAIDSGETEVLEELHYEPLDTCFSVNVYPSEQGLAVYFRDVTEAREAREELEQREAMLERQAALLEEAQDAILVRDAANRITYWNRSAERVYGWSAHEAIGADIRELLYHEPSAFDAATAAVFERGSWSGELEQRDRRGETLIIAGRWTLVSDANDQPEAVLAINTDVTEQKRIEQQLLRAQRMESLGTLAGGVAHDLNNVLSPIMLAAELLHGLEPDEDAVELIETIATSAQRGADLVTQVLSFARGVEGQRSPIDVAGLLGDIRAVIRDTFPKNIEARFGIPSDLRMLTGDSTQIQQVLLNLAVNARDAMPDGGQLTVTAAEVALDAQYVAATPGTAVGDYLLIEVEDNGTGMTPAVRERVFEPFFTTKPVGAGTGLGLSTSAAIASSHGGFLHVYSELARGSRFRLYLPMDTSAAGQAPSASLVADLPRGQGQTVLIVDDEAAVRAMTRQTLEAYGYRALEASNGAEAVSVFAQHRDEVDVVLSDMMMPIMDGPAAIHALKSLNPTIKIIGASGLHGNGKVAQAASAGVRHFLPKPYTSARLLETLQDILHGDER